MLAHSCHDPWEWLWLEMYTVLWRCGALCDDVLMLMNSVRHVLDQPFVWLLRTLLTEDQKLPIPKWNTLLYYSTVFARSDVFFTLKPIHWNKDKLLLGDWKIAVTTIQSLQFNRNTSQIADARMPAPCIFFAHFLAWGEYVSSFGVEATAWTPPSRWRSSSDTVRCSSQASTTAAKS